MNSKDFLKKILGANIHVADKERLDEEVDNIVSTVKTVNGVKPDENGNIKILEPKKIVFISMQNYFINTYTIEEILRGITTADGFNTMRYTHRVQVNPLNPSAPTADYECTKIVVTGNVYRFYFGDEIAPVLVDSINNIVSPDPDWVAPEKSITIPDTTEPNMQLVTDANGKKKWESKGRTILFRSNETTGELDILQGSELLWSIVNDGSAYDGITIQHAVIPADTNKNTLTYSMTKWEIASLIFTQDYDFAEYIYRFYFGENICPIVVDVLRKNAILDPDWVAPTPLPNAEEASF